MPILHLACRFLRPMICTCTIFLGMYLNMSAAQTPCTESEVELRIRHIQDGLLPPVLVQGESSQTTKLADRMSELHVPGVSIAVIHEGKIEWARGFGVTKIGGPPVTPGTLFQAASISKPVTALAVLQLVEFGKLDLDADINQYLKSWKIPENRLTEESKVTLRRLLSHTAGMTVHGFPGYASDETVPSLVQVLNGEKPANTPAILVNIEPGKMWSYSGGGYEVLQQLLEDVTSQPFPKLMHDTILGPIDMTHSTYEQPLPQSRQVEAAMPYSADGQPIKGGPHIYPEMAAAGLWTTPSDLARYTIKVQESLAGKSSRVLSAKMVREMLTPVLNNHGLGLQVGGREPRLYFTHDGANAGFQCNLIGYNHGDGAVIMTNSDNGAQLANEILRTLAHEYGWPDFQPKERKMITVSRNILAQYVGTYALVPKLNIMITLEGGQLMAQASGQGKLPLFASSDSKFFYKVVDAEIEFTTDEKGSVIGLILHQGGRDMKAPRTSDQVPARKEITVSPKVLAQYAATYELQPGFDLVITLEGDQLIWQAAGQGKIPLFAETDMKFFSKVIDAQIEFLKDEKGSVTHLMLYQGAVEIKAPRK